MFSTVVIFFVFFHFGFSLPPSKLLDQLQPTATKNNFYNNQNRYINNINFNGVKHGSQMQQTPRGQNIYLPPDSLIHPQKPLTDKSFYLAKSFATAQDSPSIPLVQKSNQIIVTNRNPFVPRINAQTISEPIPGIQTLNNNKIINLPTRPEFYNTLPTKKAYTIIHPNGTTEHTDNLEHIKTIYPKYRLINLNEFNKSVPPIETNKPATVSPVKVYAKNPIANPTLVPLFNKPILKTLPKELPKETLFTDTSKDIKNDTKTTLITNKLLTQTLDALILQSHKNVSIAGQNTVKSELQPSQDRPPLNVVVEKVNNTKSILTETPGSENYAQNNISKAIDNGTLSKQYQTDLNTLIQDNKVTSDGLSQVNASNVNKTLSETSDIVDDDARSETSIGTDLNNIIKNDKKLENYINAENTSHPTPPHTDRDAADCTISDDTDDEKFYVPNISLLKDNDTDTPFWFNAADRNVWDMLLGRNNTNTVFFFVPSALLEKDTTVTVYPNGTRVEETIIVKKEGDKPIVSKTTIISHSNEEDINNT